MGDTIDDQQQPVAGSVGAVEGTPAATPSSDEIAELYKATGVKAPVPTDKAKGRPKANGGGAKKDSEQDDDGGAAGKGKASVDGKDKSKASSASSKNGSDGRAADSKGSKGSSEEGSDGQADGKVSKDGADDEEGVRKTQSRNNQDASKTGEGDDDGADGGDGEDGGESEDSSEEGKRPGKSNPEIEKRFQKLTGDLKEKDSTIEKLQAQLRERDQKAAQAKIAAEDPEYTVDDFRKVKDPQGNIHDLSPEQAELFWRRWKEGYDQRATERSVAAQKAAEREAEEDAHTQRLMETSVKAYDTLANLMDDYPELVKGDKFDADFAADAMPIINEAVQYLEGTEPGNPEGKLPIIVGLKVDPRKILEVLKRQKERKRSLPLNGTRDNVESGSNVGVPHSRSSDPAVNQANDLMKELGINKRF